MHRKPLPGLLLLLVLAALALLLPWPGQEQAPEPAATASQPGKLASTNGAAAQSDNAAADGPVGASPAIAERQAAFAERQAALPDQFASASERSAGYPQGLRGKLVDEHGQPLRGIEVYLLESLRNEPLTVPLLLQQGLPPGPLAATHSGSDGQFALGLRVPTDKLYELRLLSPRHARQRLGDLRILPDTWHDLGTVTLLPGTTLRGRVLIAGTNTPVPQAIVTLATGSVFDDIALRGLPGFELGHSVGVDAFGQYEIPHAPTRGRCELSAVAPGFARLVRQDLDLSTPGPLVVDFGLLPGLSIRGRLLDDKEQPVERGRVEAWPQQGNSPPALAMSGADGRFELGGLQTGLYRLLVRARGFLDHEVRDLNGGGDELLLRLRPRARLHLRALGPDQQVLRRYEVGVRRWFPQGEDALRGQLGLLAELPDQRVRLDGYTDEAILDGLPHGIFVVEVRAEGFATALSAPFEIGEQTREHSLSVRLHGGFALSGRVLDEAGRPLAGARVESQAHGANPDNPVWRMLAQAAPERVTKRRTETAADGSFRLSGLADGYYQLQFDHAEACQLVWADLRLQGPGEQQLAPVRLPAGTLIRGSVICDGKVPAQAKVVLASTVEPAAVPGDKPAGPVTTSLRLEAFTDASGTFRMPRRVPPGHYELRAAVAGTGDPDADVFLLLQQMQRSALTFQVQAGEAERDLQLEIPVDR